MKKITFTSLIFAASFHVAHAADSLAFSTDEIVAMSRVLQAYALVSALIVALVTCAIVFRSAKKMKGGIFGKVLNYFGSGMVVVFLGYVIDAYPTLLPMIDIAVIGTITNILIIFGYILMAVAATKLSHAIEGKS